MTRIQKNVSYWIQEKESVKWLEELLLRILKNVNKTEIFIGHSLKSNELSLFLLKSEA